MNLYVVQTTNWWRNFEYGEDKWRPCVHIVAANEAEALERGTRAMRELADELAADTPPDVTQDPIIECLRSELTITLIKSNMSGVSLFG